MQTIPLERLSAAEESELVQAWKERGDPRDGRRLLAAFDPWLRALARRATRGAPGLVEDALQEGRIAFLGALQRTSFEPGWRVSIHAKPYVVKAMHAVAWAHMGAVGFIGKTAAFQRIHRHLGRAEHRALQDLERAGRPFTPHDVLAHAARLLMVSAHDIATYRALLHGGVSKDAPLFDDSEDTWEPVCTAPAAADTVEAAQNRGRAHAVLRGLLPSLHPVERRIVEERVLRASPLPRPQMAQMLRMGHERYAVVESHALDKVARMVRQALGLEAITGAPHTDAAPTDPIDARYAPRRRRSRAAA